MTMFTGPQVQIVQAAVLKSAIKMYVNTGMKVNTAYTPANMLATASKITGKAYKRGQLKAAWADLEAWLATQKAKQETTA